MAAVASCSSLPAYTMSSPSSSRDSSASPPPSPRQPTFAFAQIKGDVCLVQVPDAPAPGATSSALMAADVHVFRHEFITLFRYSHRASVHPADMHILEPIADHCMLYEAEKGTVFLARDVLARLQTLSSAAAGRGRAPHLAHRSRYSLSPPRMHPHPHPHAHAHMHMRARS